jgi:hypothetical protein
LARAQGEACVRALEYMVRSVADTGGSTESGDYRAGYAVDKGEGMYEWSDGELGWQAPGDSGKRSRCASSRRPSCATTRRTGSDSRSRWR